MSARPIDAEFDAEARSICSDLEAWWERLRAFNRSEGRTGAELDAIMASRDAIGDRAEELRRRYFPRAHRLVVQNGAAITSSPTARSIKRVWTARPSQMLSAREQ